MITWILIAIVGGILSIWGFTVLFSQYRQGIRTRRYLYAMIVGYVSFVLFVLISAAQPEFTSGIVSVVILLPAFIAIVVLANEYQKLKKSN